MFNGRYGSECVAGTYERITGGISEREVGRVLSLSLSAAKSRARMAYDAMT